MPVKISTLPPRAQSNPIGVQVLFFWTRSVIARDSSMLVFPADAHATPLPPTTARGDMQLLFELGPDVDLPEGLEVRTQYVGEALREIRADWVYSEQDVINPRTLKRRWICCRQSGIRTPAQAYFLDLDINTNPPLFFLELSSEAARTRTQVIQAMQGNLHDRLRWRAGFTGRPGLPLAALASVADLMERLIRSHYQEDWSAAIDGFEQFACGLLAQDCEIGPRYPTFRGGDIDTGLVFAFAELVFAILEAPSDPAAQPQLQRWQQRASFWRRFLNVFVRMQNIYLARWSGPNDPRCMKYYNHPVPPLAAVPESVARLFADLGDDEARLAGQMSANLRHVSQGTPECHGERCFID